MTPQEQITAYFKDIATRHPSIRHTEAKPRFFELEWEEMMQTASPLAATSWVLVLEEYTENLRDNDGDYLSLLPTMAVMVGIHVPQGRKSAKDAAFRDSRTICWDIVDKMKADELAACDADVPAGVRPPRLMDLSSVKLQPIKLPYFDHTFGTRLTFRWRVDKDLDLPLDGTRVAWLPLA